MQSGTNQTNHHKHSQTKQYLGKYRRPQRERGKRLRTVISASRHFRCISSLPSRSFEKLATPRSGFKTYTQHSYAMHCVSQCTFQPKSPSALGVLPSLSQVETDTSLSNTAEWLSHLAGMLWNPAQHGLKRAKFRSSPDQICSPSPWSWSNPARNWPTPAGTPNPEPRKWRWSHHPPRFPTERTLTLAGKTAFRGGPDEPVVAAVGIAPGSRLGALRFQLLAVSLGGRLGVAWSANFWADFRAALLGALPGNLAIYL